VTNEMSVLKGSVQSGGSQGGCKVCIAKFVYDPGMKSLPIRVITGPYHLHFASRAGVKRMMHRFRSRH